MQAVFKQRRKEIMDYRKEHPEISLAAIGARFGISKQRVFQIIKEETNNGDD